MKQATPIIRSLMHAAGFVVVLIILAVAGHFVDAESGKPEAWLGVKGFLDSGTHLLLMKVGIAITLAVSLNLILGIAGQFSLGHAGFVAAGAYTSALTSGLWFEPQLKFWMNGPLHLGIGTAFQMVLLAGMAAGAVVAAIMGLLVGLPTLRLRGDYLAIATLGFGEILSVLINNTEILGKSTGLSLIGMRSEWVANQPDPDVGLAKAVSDYMDNTTYYVGFFWVFAMAALTIYVVRNIKYATSGRALLALRENAVASESVGVPTTRYKVTAFVIGAALAGAAGGLVSHNESLVNPESFRFMRSVALVAMVILGGQGSITGTVLAAIFLEAVPEILRRNVPPAIMDPAAIEKWRMVIYSAAIILAIRFFPRGLFGRFEINDLFKHFWPGKRGLESKAEATGVLMPTPARVSVEPLLSAAGLTMQFGGLRAVEDFNLDLLPGELVGLIGPNGAGKTTVFNVLTGVYRPTEGTIRVDGRSAAARKPHAISRMGMARTFQNIRLFANLTVIDNVKIAQHAHHRRGIPAAVFRIPGFYREEDLSQRQAMEFLEIFGLAGMACEQAGSLSYGDQRRLEIARALATRPKVLLLDEPAAGMNPTEKRELMEMIQGIRKRFGLTILIIEHDMKVIMGICERIIVLDYGRMIAQGTPPEIRRNPAVIEAYLGAGAKQV